MGRLFWKFFLSILLAQLAATVGIGGTFWLHDRARQQHRLDIDTGPPAEMAIEAAAATLAFGGPEALRSLLAGMTRHRVFAVDQDGRELLGRTVSPAMLAEARTLLAQGGARRVVRELAGANGPHYLLFLPAPAAGPGADPAGGPRAGALPPWFGPGPGPGPGPGRPPPTDGNGPPDMAHAPPPPEPPGLLRNPHYRALIPVAAATLASLLFAFLLAWYFSRPIRALRQAFEAASGGDLAPRFAAAANRRGDELSDLGRDFDRMSARLRDLIDAQTRLLHDVSHELRSPLARLQAAIGLAHQQPDKAQASLERIERESMRMDKLVGELLTLSRLEAGAHASLNEEICVDELVDAIVDDARFEASARNVRVTLRGQSGALVTGQAELLGRALENVVRNAIKHSPAGGEVQLEVGVDSGARPLRITVLDRGPGVAAPDLAAIFQPFFRASAHNNTEGHGLGLAIARHVILAHHGTIAAHNRAGGGLCVEMVLPTAPASA